MFNRIIIEYLSFNSSYVCLDDHLVIQNFTYTAKTSLQC